MSTSSVPETTIPSTFDTSKLKDVDGLKRDMSATDPSEKGRSWRHPFRKKRDKSVDSGIGTDIDEGSDQSDPDDDSGDHRSLSRKIKDKFRRKDKDTSGTDTDARTVGSATADNESIQTTEPSRNSASGTQTYSDPKSTWSPPTVSRYTVPETTATGYQVDPTQTHCWTTANGESHIVFGTGENGCTVELPQGFKITYRKTQKADGGTKHTVVLGDAEPESSPESEPPRTRSRPREEPTDTRRATAYSQSNSRSMQPTAESVSDSESGPRRPKRKEAESRNETSTPTSRPEPTQTDDPAPSARPTTATKTTSPTESRTSRRNTNSRPSDVDTDTDRPRKLQKKAKKSKKTGPSAYDWLTSPHSRRTLDMSGLSDTERMDKTLATLDTSSRALHSMYQFDDPEAIPEMSRWLTDTVMHNETLTAEQEAAASQGVMNKLESWADEYGDKCTRLESRVNPYVAARSTATDMTGQRKLYSHKQGTDGTMSTLGEWLSEDPDRAEWRLKKYLQGSNYLTNETGPSLYPTYHSKGVSRWVDEPTEDNWNKLVDETWSLQSNGPGEIPSTAHSRPLTEAEEDAAREAQLRKNMDFNRKVTAPRSILKKGRRK